MVSFFWNMEPDEAQRPVSFFSFVEELLFWGFGEKKHVPRVSMTSRVITQIMGL